MALRAGWGSRPRPAGGRGGGWGALRRARACRAGGGGPPGTPRGGRPVSLVGCRLPRRSGSGSGPGPRLGGRVGRACLAADPLVMLAGGGDPPEPPAVAGRCRWSAAVRRAGRVLGRDLGARRRRVGTAAWA